MLNYLRPTWVGERVPTTTTECPPDVRDYWFAHVATISVFDPDKEHLAVAFLDTKLR